VSVHRYETADLVKDDLRAVAGLAVFGAPLVFLKTVPWITVLLAAGSVVFALFLGRCVLRHRTGVLVSDTRIEIRSLRSTVIDWQDINHVSLKHYSPRRRSGRGWMQLTLSDGAKKIVIESGLDNFHNIVRRAASVIGRNRLDVSTATRANFKAMNINLPAADGVE